MTTQLQFNRAERKARITRNVITGAIVFFLAVWALVVLFPFYFMLLTSLKDYGAYNAEFVPKLYTLRPVISNYVEAFRAVPLAKYFLNTLIFTLSTTALMLVCIIPAAYAFSRLNFRFKDTVFTLLLALMMIPSELVMITNFVTVSNLDLRNTFSGLILPSVLSVFYIYLLKENFSQIPDELYRAAKVDGTTDFKYMLRVVVPICRPTIITVTILKMIECWNSYVWPRLITDDAAYYLVSNGIQEIRENGFGRENIPAMMAAVVVISAPLILLFFCFRNKIMEGVAKGGLKG
jgi:multiple sugar transport system permease protein